MTATRTVPVLADGDEVQIDGRLYRIVLGEPNCASIKHYHFNRHADGTLGNEAHHHHNPLCAEMPRQATLYLVGAEPRHAHEFGPGGNAPHECACGAWREPSAVRQGSSRADGQLLAYHMPPDENHPEGWRYTRREKAAS